VEEQCKFIHMSIVSTTRSHYVTQNSSNFNFIKLNKANPFSSRSGMSDILGWQKALTLIFSSWLS